MARIQKLTDLDWYYENNKVLDIIPNNMTHFVYKITEIKTGKFYIGYKGFYTKRKKRLTKKELSSDSRRKTYKIEIKESNWRQYNSSNKELSELVAKNPNNFKKEILLFCNTEKKARYYEAKYQFLEDVIEKDTFNGTILGKFFRRDLI